MNELSHWMGVVALVVGVPLNLYVVFRLRRLVRKYLNPVTRERAVVARAVLVVVAVFGSIFISNDAIPPWLDPALTRLITRAAILMLAIGPAVRWIRLERRD